MSNSLPAVTIGGLTLCGVLIRTDTAIVVTSILASLMCVMVMVQIIWRCRLRDKRLKDIETRRRNRRAHTPTT